ncbi:WXG100 family type VII secretion target [Amycolatopsis jejuensis]|uniref:WXG100 family type VII secretion target n=1 Tax=Amycolatopsis jejuensis TaxID=330084 RepID=UPI000524E15F|nr:WXG100 family type VII secretion target [Amycolatopsis jejuensis]
MSNPLVSAPVSSTTAISGIPLLEDAKAVKTSIESGDWSSAVLGAAGTALDALGTIADPFGAILSAGVGWLMEHVGPLKDALDTLAGNPDQITSYSTTWQNVAKELKSIGEDVGQQVQADLQGWSGEAADAYRQRASDLAALMSASSEMSDGAAKGVQTAGEVVAAVRSLVRDTIAQVVGHLISWALQVLLTLGIGLAWVVPQVVSLVAKTAAKITGLVQRLVKALKALGQLLGKARSVFERAGDAMKGVKTGKTGKPGSVPPLDKTPKLPTDRPRSGPGGGSGHHPSGHGSGSTGPSGSHGSTGPSRALGPDKYDGDHNLTSPGAPTQHPHGGGSIPQHTHDHVNQGNLKPPRPHANPKKSKPASFTGGHVLSNQLPPGTKPSATLGSGIHGGTPVPGPAKPNGVYNIQGPYTQNSAGNLVPKLTASGKPGQSTMFPPNTNSGLTGNVANQAWNGGKPHGGFAPAGHQTTSQGHPSSYTWNGHGQIPYTPIWDPANPGKHGAAPPKHDNPHAGQIINVTGYANPHYPAGKPVPPPNAAPGHPDPSKPAPPPLDVNPSTYFPSH